MTTFPPIDTFSPAERERFFDGPAQRPPPGVTPRPGDTPDNNGIAWGITVVCVTLTTAAVVLRAYSQIFVKRKVNVEDGLGILAFAAFCGILWTTLQLLEYRMFHNHQWDISVRDHINILFALYIWPTLYTILMAFIKPAILLEWAKIFAPKANRRSRNRFWWACMSMIVFNQCVYIASFVGVQCYCTPHVRIWKRWVPGTCINRKSVDFPSAVFNLIVDILIVLLPQRVLWRLQLNTLKKMSVSVIFGIGILAVVAAIGRVYAIAVLDYQNDVTYHATPVYLWSMAECTCVMLVFCIPPIPRIFNKHNNSRKLEASLQSTGGPSFSIRKVLSSSCSNNTQITKERVRGVASRDGQPMIRSNSGYNEGSQVQLAELTAVAYPSAKQWQTGYGGDGIIYTRTFRTEEQFVSNTEYNSWDRAMGATKLPQCLLGEAREQGLAGWRTLQ